MKMSYNLPNWLIKVLPEDREPYILTYKNGKYLVSIKGITLKKTFQSLVESYDYIKSENNVSIKFDKSLPEYNENFWGTLLLIPKDKPDTKHGKRALISFLDSEHKKILESEYSRFLEYSDKYNKDSKDFFIAYSFITLHPMFWVATDDTFLHWKTFNKIDVDFIKNENNEVKCFVEAGPHIDPSFESEHAKAYRLLSIDSNLLVEGKTYEETILKLAKKIKKYYNYDGTVKNN